MIIAIIQARMGSKRLPGKTLMKIRGKPLLGILLERVRASKLLNDIVIATTTNEKDDVIVDFCKKNNCKFFRGSEDDVLDRVLKAAKFFNADLTLELTADNPLVDPEVIDKLIQFYFGNDYDHVCNFHPHTFPIGSYLQIYSTKILDEVNKLTDDPYDRENVSMYIYNHPERYKLGNMEAEEEFRYPSLRLTVDYEEDFLLIKKIIEHFKDELVSLKNIIKFIKENPELKKINEKYDI